MEPSVFETLREVLPELWVALGQTALMLGCSLAAALLFGLPLGALLLLSGPGQPLERPRLFAVLNAVVNTVRSFPFIILMVALVPLTRFVVGTTIGPLAAAVPLSFAAIPYFARLVEQSLREVPRGVVEAAQAMGASNVQIVFKVLLPEARSSLVSGYTVL
ncbi:MAG: methionine ABC transporter permease, partial [Myxococcota bacterium]